MQLRAGSILAALLATTSAASDAGTDVGSERDIAGSRTSAERPKRVDGTISVVRVGDRTGTRGVRVIVPISFIGNGDTVGFTADVGFDPARLSVVSAQAAAGASCQALPMGSPDRIAVARVSGAPFPDDAEIRFCDVVFQIGSNATAGIANLTVTTSTCTDSLGGDAPCATDDGAIGIAALQTSLSDGTNIVIAAHDGTLTETRRVRLTNNSAAALDATCDVMPSGLGLAQTTNPMQTIAPGATVDVVVSCQMPVLGTPDRLGTLTCTTTDPLRPTLRYGLTCTTVPDGSPLPDEQLFDNQLEMGDNLGTSVAQGALPGTGTQVVALGAPLAGGDSNGRVLIFEGSPQSAKREAGRHLLPVTGGMRLVAAFGAPPNRRKAVEGPFGLADLFGQSVAMSPDGLRLAVGAPSGGPNGIGEVYIYDRPNSPDGWGSLDFTIPNQTITPPTTLAGARLMIFGDKVRFAPGGGIIISAPGSGVGAFDGAGAVVSYPATGGVIDTGNPTPLVSTNPVTGGAFGSSMDVTPAAVVIGAPQEGSGGSQSGAGYVFGVVGDTFTAPVLFTPPTIQPGDKFGAAIAISGTSIVVGSPGATTAQGNGSGVVTLFRNDNPIVPVPVTQFVPAPGLAQSSGASVATNGDMVIVGAPQADVGAVSDKGRVYAYKLQPSYPAFVPPVEIVENASGETNDGFGRAVSINKTQMVVGVPFDDLKLHDNSTVADVGRADPFLLDGVFRDGFE